MAGDEHRSIPPPEITHPYAVSVPLRLGDNVELVMDEVTVCVPFTDDCIIRIVQEHSTPREQANAIKRVSIDLEAFSSASEAERAGKLFVLSLLWVAASRRITLAFEQWTGEFPFAVRDRRRSRGISVRGEGRTYRKVAPDEFATIAARAYTCGANVNSNTLVSMEFYAAARMEPTDRGRFISLMIALEALSSQIDYGPGVAKCLAELESSLEHCSELQGEGHRQLRGLLSQRLKNLRRESVRHAIIRLLQGCGFDQEEIRVVDDAYEVRSKILHEGFRAPQLGDLTNRLESIMRRLYSTHLSLPLVVTD